MAQNPNDVILAARRAWMETRDELAEASRHGTDDDKRSALAKYNQALNALKQARRKAGYGYPEPQTTQPEQPKDS